jgi:hypothetical protein
VTGAADVPAEAVRAIADVLFTLDHEHCGSDGGSCVGSDMPWWLAAVRDAFTAAAEAGWVLVPGPVRTQWGQMDKVGAVWPRRDEADAFAFAFGDGSDVRQRQVTEWRPAQLLDARHDDPDPTGALTGSETIPPDKSTPCDAAYPETAGYKAAFRCQKPAGHDMPHLTLQSGSADAWAPESTQDGEGGR